MARADIERAAQVKTLLEGTKEHPTKYKFMGFFGATLMNEGRGYKVLTRPDMVRVAWENFPGVSPSRAGEMMEVIGALAQNTLSGDHLSRYIATGVDTTSPRVWDAKEARWLDADETPLEWVYQTNVVVPEDTSTDLALKFLRELSNGDEDLAYDYAQGLAPLLLEKKPAGVIWFVGDGANGKSVLLNVVHRLFGNYLTSLTTSAIEDGRDTPRLNGMLGNVCLEASEARVEDSERYKALGTHEPFMVHKFHSQDTILVTPNAHSVMNSNNIPTFRDKTKGSRRRTLVIPFPAHFADDPTFEGRLITHEFLASFMALLTEVASEIKERGLKYKWSDATLLAKKQYDDSVNSAESYVGHLIEINAVGFTNYRTLNYHYESFCHTRGIEPLRVGALKRAISDEFAPERRTVTKDMYKSMTAYTWTDNFKDVNWWENGIATRTEVEPEMVQVGLNEW